MIRLGLTGSIGMGKTTTAGLFAEAGIPVYDADAAVHALYSPGGAAVEAVEAAFPGVTHGGAVDRARLAERLTESPDGFARLEGVVHPLLRAAREAFFAEAAARVAKVVVLDIPLLFETGGQALVDAVVVVSAPEAVQRERALARPGMSEAKLAAILARQLPDAEKRARADFIIDTGSGLAITREQVRRVLETVTQPGWTSPRRDHPTL